MIGLFHHTVFLAQTVIELQGNNFVTAVHFYFYNSANDG